jgi:hypothetical protein
MKDGPGDRSMTPGHVIGQDQDFSLGHEIFISPFFHEMVCYVHDYT